MDKIISWHGKAEVKADAIYAARFHREADLLQRGTYWNGQRGCGIGCHAHHLSPAPSEYRSDQYRIVSRGYGWPIWLIALEDWLFENGTFEKAIKLPEAICQAIPVGVDLTPVFYEMLGAFLDVFERSAVLSTTAVYNDLRVLIGEGTMGMEPRKDEWARCKQNAQREAVARGEVVRQTFQAALKSASPDKARQTKIRKDSYLWQDLKNAELAERAAWVAMWVAAAGWSDEIEEITHKIIDWDNGRQELADRIADKLLRFLDERVDTQQPPVVQ